MTEREGFGIKFHYIMKMLLCKNLIPGLLMLFCALCSAGEPTTNSTATADINLMASIQAGRIILLWDPPNSAPSDGVKVQRSLTPEFDMKSIDQYTKWLPGTGYNQVVLFPSAASEKTYYYRVSSIKTGEYAQCLGISNAVKVEALKKTEDETSETSDSTDQPKEQI